MELILAGPRVSQVAPGDYRGATHQVPAHAFTAARRLLHELRIQRKYATVLRQRLLLAGERTIFHFDDLEHCRRTDDVLDARRVVDAGQLHQNPEIGIAAALLLHHGFSEAQGVDAVADGLHRAIDRVAFQRQKLGGPHVQTIVGRVDCGDDPGGQAVRYDAPEGGGFVRRNSFDGDLDGVRGINGVGLVILHRSERDPGLTQLFFEALYGLLRLHFDRILHLHLQHQVAAAAEIEAQLDVFLQVVLHVAD